MEEKPEINFDDFQKAQKSAYRLKINSGNSGIKTSNAQITSLYKKIRYCINRY
jgi:hypothetical protein